MSFFRLRLPFRPLSVCCTRIFRVLVWTGSFYEKPLSMSSAPPAAKRAGCNFSSGRHPPVGLHESPPHGDPASLSPTANVTDPASLQGANGAFAGPHRRNGRGQKALYKRKKPDHRRIRARTVTQYGAFVESDVIFVSATRDVTVSTAPPAWGGSGPDVARMPFPCYTHAGRLEELPRWTVFPWRVLPNFSIFSLFFRFGRDLAPQNGTIPAVGLHSDFPPPSPVHTACINSTFTRPFHTANCTIRHRNRNRASFPGILAESF